MLPAPVKQHGVTVSTEHRINKCWSPRLLASSVWICSMFTLLVWLVFVGIRCASWAVSWAPGWPLKESPSVSWAAFSLIHVKIFMIISELKLTMKDSLCVLNIFMVPAESVWCYLCLVIWDWSGVGCQKCFPGFKAAWQWREQTLLHLLTRFIMFQEYFEALSSRSRVFVKLYLK